jgi:hypothetical protein
MSEKKTLNGRAVISDDANAAPPECFVIMPISDQTGYDAGHFGKVYEDIFKPACAAAGFKATRADDVKQSNLIHLDILKRVVHSPMAICDLSSRNPNVLFELGLRQAFDKPTILVKDEETPDIFDIAPIRYTGYRRALRYREVLADQLAIAEGIRSTRDAVGNEHNVNSLIRLLELSAPASISEGGAKDPNEYFQVLMAEVSELRREIRTIDRPINEIGRMQNVPASNKPVAVAGRAAKSRQRVETIIQRLNDGISLDQLTGEIREALRETEGAISFYARPGETANPARLDSVLRDLDTLKSMMSP